MVDPLVGLVGFDAREDRRHDRCTLSMDDLQRLVTAAATGPTFRAMTGPARSLCYRLAVATGLRYSEIRSITPESLDMDAHQPTVVVAASYTKNGTTATLPLPGELAADLAAFVAGLAPGMSVFPLPDKGADMLEIDLNAAGSRTGTSPIRCSTSTRCGASAPRWPTRQG